MANLWLDLKGPILADTVYVDGVLAAKDVTIAFPFGLTALYHA